MRLLVRILAGLAVALLVAVATVYAISSRRMSQAIPLVDHAPLVATDSATVARGEYLVRAIVKCGDCHDADLGGQLFIDGGPLGTFYAPNLTSGIGSRTTAVRDADIVHAMRHGLGPGGRKLAWMPSRDWNELADDDAAAIVAYLRSVPAVNRESRPSTVGPLGRVLYLVGALPLYDAESIAHEDTVRAKPVAGPTDTYGAYLAAIGGCQGCHGPTLSGGRIPGTPPEFKPASNLTPAGLGSWTEADFFRALREGVRPDGSVIDSLMPVTATRRMTDADTRALWQFLMGVPRKAYGGR